jgi:hypothetical protein
MTDEPNPNALPLSGAAAELQAGKLAIRGRAETSVIAAIGAMVIGILLAVAAIVGAARPRR